MSRELSQFQVGAKVLLKSDDGLCITGLLGARVTVSICT
jgi:hypothetical protein